MKQGYKSHIEQETVDNENFRKVLYTAEHSQLVLMSLKPGEEIGLEVHEKNDQFFRFEKGEGKVVVNDTEYSVGDGDAVIVPSGSQHNVINTGDRSLRFYTIYSPAHHRDGTVHKTKSDALADNEEFSGATTEL